MIGGIAGVARGRGSRTGASRGSRGRLSKGAGASSTGAS